ncbi:MAG: amidase [Betaproteobacteria bacterium]|nr:MAG: amidase [Betaproteobacteria bacterium]
MPTAKRTKVALGSDIAFSSASRLADMIRRRKIGCLELLDHYLDRVSRLNPRINAIVVFDEQRARTRAKKADRAAATGDWWGPLHGVPMTVKESFDIAGLATTWGHMRHRKNIASHNALSVNRLLGAGAVIFGKSNTPVGLADWQTYNPVYGTTNNPWDVSRVPGGSSGGAAAALAAGLTGLELGSDIGASIRNPAHYCGVFGHKPTFQLCPIHGHNLPPNLSTRDMVVIGPLARSADDLALVLGIIGQPDEFAARGIRVNLPKPQQDIRKLRIAVLTDAATAEVDDSVQAGVLAAAQCFARAGATVSDKACPDFNLHDAHRTYIHLLRGATSPAVSDKDYATLRRRAPRVRDDDDSYQAWMIRATTMSHRDWHGWNEKREALRHAWLRFFHDWDLLLCPTAASAAFEHNQHGERWQRMIPVNGRPQPTTTQLFWAGLSGMVYLPATVAPVAFTDERLPVGVQIIGPQYGDLQCITAAKFLQRELQPFVAPDEFL